MTSAGMGFTNPEAGVMATNPATAPEIPPSTLGLPLRIHSTPAHPSAAAAAAKWVATNALVAKLPAANALPALNPNHPTHNMQAPIKLSTTLCGGICSLGYPTRFPMYSAQTRAETPEVTCTTVPPAKSSVGNLPPSDAFSNPPLPQTMCAMGSYTMIDHSTVNASIALNFMRSANAPAIKAGVMIANIN